LIYFIFSVPVFSTEQTDEKLKAESYEAACEEEPEEDRKSFSFKKKSSENVPGF
jgi:hypothetical protein